VRVIAVTGGKGGVGKTNVCTNLGIALARRGHEVMLLDADLGLANVEVLLGLRLKHNLSHVMSGEMSLEEIIVTGPGGLRIVPGASGVAHMASLSAAEQAGLVQAFSAIPGSLDYFLIDTAAGITEDVINFTRAAQEVAVVVCDEPASITDAYALIKILSREHGVERFHIVANMVSSAQEGRKLYSKMSTVTERFLDVILHFLGSVPQDDYLRRAVQQQRAVAEAFPRSPSATSFEQMAATAEGWSKPRLARGHLEFFMERLVQAPLNEAG
jgi:flagellar biosynthesis protein FlhG